MGRINYPIYLWKIKAMFETTNHITIIFPLLVYSLLTTINPIRIPFIYVY